MLDSLNVRGQRECGLDQALRRQLPMLQGDLADAEEVSEEDFDLGAKSMVLVRKKS